MKKIIVSFMIVCAVSCNNTPETSVAKQDSPLHKINVDSLESANQIKNILAYAQAEKTAKENSAFVARIFSVTETIESDPGCNRLTARYIVEVKKHNEDSIMKAMKIFTDSVFLSLTNYKGCSPRKCVLSIFESPKLFRENNWLALGTRFNEEDSKITYRSEVMQEFLK
jgi:hypothetical protein